jgi:hypothetical protein
LDLGQNLSSSIDYSRKLFTDLGRLIILIVLDVIPIVNLTVLGYICKIIKESPTSNELPPLREFFSLWVQGLKVAVAAIIYLIVPFVLIVPFLPVMAFPGLLAVGWVLAIPMIIVGVLLMFFICIIMTLAIVHMVKEDSFGKAFAVGEILDIIRKIGWGSYISWLVVMFVCALIVGAVGSIPIIGWLISLVIAPVFGVFVSRSASLVYSEGAPPIVAPSVTERTPTLPTEEKKVCMFCGAEMFGEAVYCPKCGKKQEA